ncbi:MAG TPA: DUF6351 family protein [Hyphomonadaceae bacterium]|nr:DUF6351 family protein [Hyphomonadaceae bacterium]
MFTKVRAAASCAVLAFAISAPAMAQSASPMAAAAKPAQGKIEVKVLSSRFDLVSGGDALVEVKASEGAKASELRLSLNGRDLVTPLKFDQPSNTLRGMVTGLDVGGNWLQVTGPTGYTVSQPLVNHPITGPILSGPHMTPYECRTKESGLGDPTDANCSAPTRYDWFYKTTAPAGGEGPGQASMFKPLANPKGPRPADLATTTTIDGKTVPYIVRVESGVINRSVYRIAVLDDPATDGFSPAEGWNNRVGFTFGGGCGTQYNQGTNQVTSILSDLYLARGFIYVNSTELVNGQHCNQVLQGETLMMLKEHVVEAYGAPKWTVGTGGSGGSIQQLVISQMYPGLLDGLQPSLSYPDSSMNTADCGLLQNFWRTAEGKKFSADKQNAVAGYSPGTCGSWERSFVPVMTATNARGCALNDASLLYDPKKNPKGARCTVTDMRVNVYGRDPKTGFARKPQDNVGVQYGLKALNDGVINVNEFLTLNEKIGGNDIDGGFIKARSVGDPAALNAIYGSGSINTFKNLDLVPIIHYRTYNDTLDPGDIHDRHRDLTIRARLEKATGSSANQAIWVADRAPGRGQPAKVNLAPIALTTMTQWLDAMAADPAPLTPAKVVSHKPADATDAYWTPDGKRVNETASWDPSTSWNKIYPVHLEPRLVAGAPPANDVMKCQLKPVDMADYKAKFTSAQQSRLKKVFKDGVCDWSKPSVGYSQIKGTYQKY